MQSGRDFRETLSTRANTPYKPGGDLRCETHRTRDQGGKQVQAVESFAPKMSPLCP